MGRLAWYKAEPRAFFEGTRNLTFEEKAAYRLVLDLIYDHDGQLPDNERFVAGQLGLHTRAWGRLRLRLIELGKLYLAEGMIRNPKADRTVAEALGKLTQTSAAGERSGSVRRALAERTANKPLKPGPQSGGNNGLAGTDVPTDAPETKSQSKKEDSTPLIESEPVTSDEDGGKILALAQKLSAQAPMPLNKAQCLIQGWVGQLGLEDLQELVDQALSPKVVVPGKWLETTLARRVEQREREREAKQALDTAQKALATSPAPKLPPFQARCASLGYDVTKFGRHGYSIWAVLSDEASRLSDEQLRASLDWIDQHPGLAWRRGVMHAAGVA